MTVASTLEPLTLTLARSPSVRPSRSASAAASSSRCAGARKCSGGLSSVDRPGPEIAVAAEQQGVLAAGATFSGRAVGRSSVYRCRDVSGPLRRSLEGSPGACSFLPANSAAADLLGAQAAVDPDFLGERREHLGDGAEPGLVIERRGQLAERLPAGAHRAGVLDAWAHPLQAAVGVGHRPLLLGMALQRQHDVGELRRSRPRTSRRRARSRPPEAPCASPRSPDSRAPDRRRTAAAPRARPARARRGFPPHRGRAPSRRGRGRRRGGLRPRAARARC